MRAIRINHPGDGEWIMDRVGGVFHPGMDHSIATHDGERLLGGFVFTSYLGNSIAVHDAAQDPRWCPRDLLWMMFHYVFRQLGCRKLFAPTASTNIHALALNLRAGFRLEAVLHDAVDYGVHLMILSMAPAECRWLKLSPQQYLPGGGATKDLVNG